MVVLDKAISCTFRLGKLTVENCLGQGHDSSAEANQDSLSARTANKGLALTELLGPGKEDIPVGKIHARLKDIQHALGSGEATAGMKCLPAIDVVDLAIQLVRRPQRPVHPAVLHGVRAAEHVDGVPDDERQGDGEPEERGRIGGVRPAGGRRRRRRRRRRRCAYAAARGGRGTRGRFAATARR